MRPGTRKRVLLVGDDPSGRGGTERGLLQTATWLSPVEWDPIVLVPARGALSEMLERAGVPTLILNFYRLPRFWRLRRFCPLDAWATMLVNGWRLKRFIERERIALVHTAAKASLNARNVAWVGRAAGIPVVWSCHDSNPGMLTYCSPGLGDALARVMAVSQHVKDELLRAGMNCPDRIEVVHNAVDLDAWDAQASAEQGSLRHELGLPDDRPVVGLVGRLDPVKGQREFLEAAALVARTDREAVFLLVGVEASGPSGARFPRYLEDTRALGRRPPLEGRVVFMGWRNDLPRVMATLDILVQPSRRETFGRVLTEAMAGRRPVVVTRIGGMPEIVVDGETGLIVPPADPAALASAILALLNDPARRRAMGEAGRRRVEGVFSRPQRMRRVEAIYRDALGRRRDRRVEDMNVLGTSPGAARGMRRP